MAYLVLVNENTYRSGINNIGDVVDIQDGESKEDPLFSIVNIKGMTAPEIKAALISLMPKIVQVYKLPVAKDTWTMERPVNSRVWQDGTDWKLIEATPKYPYNFAKLSEEEITTLLSEVLEKTDKQAVLETKVQFNIMTDSANQVVVAELSAVEAPIKG